jgi:hypothetical protein
MPKDIYRFRIGNYRLFYKIDEQKLMLLEECEAQRDLFLQLKLKIFFLMLQGQRTIKIYLKFILPRTSRTRTSLISNDKFVLVRGKNLTLFPCFRLDSFKNPVTVKDSALALMICTNATHRSEPLIFKVIRNLKK